MDCSAVIPSLPNPLLSKPPPLWFVTDGDVTVGPVTTNLLVRGVFHRRIPEYCLVRERTSKAWRKLERIREVAALKHAQARAARVRRTGALALPGRGAGSVRAHGARAARRVRSGRRPARVSARSHARHGLARGRRSSSDPFRRRVRHGLRVGTRMDRRLGRSIDDADPAFVLAHQGHTLCEAPKMATPSDHVSCRLGALASSGGIAMAPIISGGHLYAVMEVGRPDHEFRREDFNRLVKFAGLAAERVGTVQNHLTRSRFRHLEG